MARAEYDFTAASEEEISLRAGDMLNLAIKGDRQLISDFQALSVRAESYTGLWSVEFSFTVVLKAMNE